jgi:hypothetical protein
LGIALLKAKEGGHDRTEELAAWRTALAAEPVALRSSVEENLRDRNRRHLLQNLRVRLGIRAVERLIRRKKTPKNRYEETPATVPDFMDSESVALARRDLSPDRAAAVRS